MKSALYGFLFVACASPAFAEQSLSVASIDVIG